MNISRNCPVCNCSSNVPIYNNKLAPISGIHVQAIVDGNPNYQGETLGEIVIEDPMVLADMPDIPVLISSFRSEAAIKVFCTERFTNRLITFYES